MRPMQPILLWYVTILHSCLGLLVLWSPAPLRLTILTILHQAGLPRYGIAGLYFVSSLFAVYGLCYTAHRNLTRVMWWFAPQQALLSIGACSSIVMIWRSTVLGIFLPVPFLLAVQLPNILLLIAYTYALLLYLYRLTLLHQCALPLEP